MAKTKQCHDKLDPNLLPKYVINFCHIFPQGIQTFTKTSLKKPQITHVMTSSEISQNPPPHVLRPQPEPSCAPQRPVRNKKKRRKNSRICTFSSLTLRTVKLSRWETTTEQFQPFSCGRRLRILKALTGGKGRSFCATL